VSWAAGLNTAANAAANSDWRQDQTNTFIVVAPSTKGTWAWAQAVQETLNINHSRKAVNPLYPFYPDDFAGLLAELSA
jgi:hypothetical protein